MYHTHPVIMTEPLAKVDSAVEGVDAKDAKPVKKPRQSTVAAAGVFKLEELRMYPSARTPPQVARPS